MLLMFAVLGLVVALDQGAKAVVTAHLQEGAAPRRLAGPVRLRVVANRRLPWGAAWSVTVMTASWVVIVASGAALASIINVPWVSIALGASLGGAAGNVIDGISRRAVVDFIDLRVWPVFNLADAAIVGGALLAGWHLLQLA